MVSKYNFALREIKMSLEHFFFWPKSKAALKDYAPEFSQQNIRADLNAFALAKDQRFRASERKVTTVV